MDYFTFRNSLFEGLEFKKPTVTSTILKIDETSFTYSIGKEGNFKKITFDILDAAYHELLHNHSFSRKWFKESFPIQEKNAPCSFTTIGGLMQHFKLATYKKGIYIKN